MEPDIDAILVVPDYYKGQFIDSMSVAELRAALRDEIKAHADTARTAWEVRKEIMGIILREDK